MKSEKALNTKDHRTSGEKGRVKAGAMKKNLTPMLHWNSPRAVEDADTERAHKEFDHQSGTNRV